jgi:hypothetical protein
VTRRRFTFLLFLASALLPSAGFAQTPGDAFPEKVLEGKAPFDLAIFYQGDLRGNFGPCG